MGRGIRKKSYFRKPLKCIEKFPENNTQVLVISKRLKFR